jgi:hypothetical protein
MLVVRWAPLVTAVSRPHDGPGDGPGTSGSFAAYFTGSIVGFMARLDTVPESSAW